MRKKKSKDDSDFVSQKNQPKATVEENENTKLKEVRSRPKRNKMKVGGESAATRNQKIRKEVCKIIKNIENHPNIDKEEKENWCAFLKESKERFLNDSGFLFKGKSNTTNFSGLDFLSLANQDRELFDGIIDFIISHHIKDESVFHQGIGTNQLLKLNREPLVPFKKEINWVISVYNQGGKHYVLYLLDKNNKTLYLLDPLSNRVDKKVGDELLGWFNEIHKKTDEDKPEKNDIELEVLNNTRLT